MKYKCLRCGHTWEPRGDRVPVACPACKSYRHQIPRIKDFRVKPDEGEGHTD